MLSTLQTQQESSGNLFSVAIVHSPSVGRSVQDAPSLPGQGFLRLQASLEAEEHRERVLGVLSTRVQGDQLQHCAHQEDSFDHWYSFVPRFESGLVFRERSCCDREDCAEGGKGLKCNKDMSKRKSAASPSEELMSSDVKKRKRNDVSYAYPSTAPLPSRPKYTRAMSTVRLAINSTQATTSAPF